MTEQRNVPLSPKPAKLMGVYESMTETPRCACSNFEVTDELMLFKPGEDRHSYSRCVSNGNIVDRTPASKNEVRSVSSTGGAKGVKPERYSLIPKAPLDLLATVYGFGTTKYAAHNYRKGYEWSKSYDALQRHLAAWWERDEFDEESGLSHLGHAAFHVFALIIFSSDKRYAEFDDRYRAEEADFELNPIARNTKVEDDFKDWKLNNEVAQKTTKLGYNIERPTTVTTDELYEAAMRSTDKQVIGRVIGMQEDETGLSVDFELVKPNESDTKVSAGIPWCTDHNQYESPCPVCFEYEEYLRNSIGERVAQNLEFLDSASVVSEVRGRLVAPEDARSHSLCTIEHREGIMYCLDHDTPSVDECVWDDTSYWSSDGYRFFCQTHDKAAVMPIDKAPDHCGLA